jgi:hypothetical protein
MSDINIDAGFVKIINPVLEEDQNKPKPAGYPSDS